MGLGVGWIELFVLFLWCWVCVNSVDFIDSWLCVIWCVLVMVGSIVGCLVSLALLGGIVSLVAYAGWICLCFVWI